MLSCKIERYLCHCTSGLASVEQTIPETDIEAEAKYELVFQIWICLLHTCSPEVLWRKYRSILQDNM